MARLQPYMELAKVPKQFGEDIVAAFIDSLGKMLAGIKEPGFEFVKTAGTLTKGDWANELHPNRQGFKKIAKRFEKTLLKHLH